MPWRSPAYRGITPQGRGRYPGFDVLSEVERWDDVTAGVVLARLAPTTDLSFFTTAEDGVATPLLDLLLGQDADPRVPVVAMVDARLAAGETDGWHYDDMPQDADAWRSTLAALDADARTTHDRPFALLSREQQACLVQAVQTAASNSDSWHDLPAGHVWSLWTRYTCAAFYSHPWAWNEIGWGGPAYPRGYKNIGVNSLERWEVADNVDADPVSFGERTEQARRAHAALLNSPTANGNPTVGREPQ